MKFLCRRDDSFSDNDSFTICPIDGNSNNKYNANTTNSSTTISHEDLQSNNNDYYYYYKDDLYQWAICMKHCLDKYRTIITSSIPVVTYKCNKDCTGSYEQNVSLVHSELVLDSHDILTDENITAYLDEIISPTVSIVITSTIATTTSTIENKNNNDCGCQQKETKTAISIKPRPVNIKNIKATENWRSRKTIILLILQTCIMI
jgi:hypothetical protein